MKRTLGLLLVVICVWIALVAAASATASLDAAQSMDVMFVIDATGSMGDEIEAVKDNVRTIARDLEATMAGQAQQEEDGVGRRRASIPATLRMGAVFFRDRSDGPKMLDIVPLSTDVDALYTALDKVRAGGGGDYPEHVGAGLHAALDQVWRRSSDVARVMYLIGDARAQRYGDDQLDIESALARAVASGITINAIGCSGLCSAGVAEFEHLASSTNGVFEHLTYARDVQTPDGPRTVFRSGDTYYKASRELDERERSLALHEQVEQGLVVQDDGAAEAYAGSAATESLASVGAQIVAQAKRILKS